MGKTFLEAIARPKCRPFTQTVTSSNVEWKIGTANCESG